MMRMKTVLAVLVSLMAGCGAVLPGESITESNDTLVPSCGDMECDVIDCTTCFACPGIESGTVTCACIRHEFAAAAACTPDAPLPTI